MFLNHICKILSGWMRPARSEEPQAPRASAAFRILLASSDPYQLNDWAAELTEMDADVVQVLDGKSALKEIRRQNFDMLIAAVSMDEKDRLELLRELNGLSKPPVRILVSRGFDVAERAYLRLARLYGADVTLTQPLENGALRRLVAMRLCIGPPGAAMTRAG
jgi:DNA-binding response OmpR family regulator